MLLTMTRLITAGLIIAAAAAFASGAAIEHHAATSEQHTELHVGPGAPGEQAGGAEGAATRENTAAHAAGHGSETLLGINPESTGLVVTAVVASLLLAALILTISSPLLAAAVAAVMLAFTALDIREVIHQLNESRPGLASLAAAIAALHLAASAAAVATTRRARATPGAA
jgi:hypothetical protein